MRIAIVLAVLAFAAGCRNGNHDQKAVHQGILDHLAEAGFSNQNMDISEKSIEFDGNKAKVLVEISPKGASHQQGMQMRYGLEDRNGRWVVVTRADAGGTHSGVVPGASNPHGASPGAMQPDSGGRMPSPSDLPPAGQKK